MSNKYPTRYISKKNSQAHREKHDHGSLLFIVKSAFLLPNIRDNPDNQNKRKILNNKL